MASTLGLTLGSAWTASALTSTIALTGELAPDGNGSYSSFNRPFLNAAGEVAAFATYTGTAGGSADNTGLIRGSGGTVTQIAREGQAAPDGNGSYDNFFGLVLNAAGEVAALASYIGTAGGFTDDTGLIRGSGGAVTQIAREGQAAPDGNGSYSSFTVPVLNAAGEVAAFAQYTGTAGGSADNTGLIRGSGGTVTQIAREGQAAPDGNGSYSSFGGPVLNAAGEVAAEVTYTGTAGGSTDDTGLIRGSGGTAIQIAREGQAAPDGNGSYSSFDDKPVLNAAGEVAAEVFYTGTAGGTTDDNALIRGNGGTVTQIAREGQAAPDGNGTYSTFTNFFGIPAINAAGEVAAEVFYVGTAGGSTDNNGLIRGSGGAVTQIAREGQAAPDGNGSYSGFGNPDLTSSGTTGFYAGLTGTAGGGADNAGFFLSDGSETLRAAREGDALEGSTITGFGDNAFALNQFGQLAYEAALADGRSGLFLFTPELFWRSGSSGSWDDTTRWTVGLRPGDPHDVSITPDFGVSVNGTAEDVTIQSLTLGAQISSTATLRNNGGGNLTVSDTITITARGNLDHENGSLTAGALRNDGILNQDGGTITLTSLENTGTVDFRGGTTNVLGPVDNQSSLDVLTGGSLTSTGGITNRSFMTLDGTLGGAPITNDFGASLNARGFVDATLVNNGTLSTTGPLTVTNAITNLGAIDVGTGETLSPDGGLTNFGAIELVGGSLTGTGIVSNEASGVISGVGAVSTALANNGGLIHANSAGTLLITDLSGGNIAGGELRVEDGSSLLVQSALSSSGNIVLRGTNASLNGGNVSNSGTVSGVGRISNAISNSGVVRADGGQLTLSSFGNSNGSAGRLEAATGNTLFFTQGLILNEGDVALTGGSFDNNGQTLINVGEILGRGTLSTGGLTNAGTIEFADGNSDVFGAVTNSAALNVTNNTTTFFDLVTNGATGTIKNTAGTARFLGGLNNSGAFISDPADNEFTDITLDGTGYLVGGEGDRFLITGDVLSSSAASVLWSTMGAELAFVGGGSHQLQYTGEDRGRSDEGYRDNMAWGALRLGASDGLVFVDGDAVPGGALYVASLILEGGLSQIASITGNGLNLYYDPRSSDNAMFGGRTFALLGGGSILPVPEPSTALLVGGGLMLLGMRRRAEVARGEARRSC